MNIHELIQKRNAASEGYQQDTSRLDLLQEAVDLDGDFEAHAKKHFMEMLGALKEAQERFESVECFRCESIHPCDGKKCFVEMRERIAKMEEVK
jgi:hypothetical protein